MERGEILDEQELQQMRDRLAEAAQEATDTLMAAVKRNQKAIPVDAYTRPIDGELFDHLSERMNTEFQRVEDDAHKVADDRALHMDREIVSLSITMGE